MDVAMSGAFPYSPAMAKAAEAPARKVLGTGAGETEADIRQRIGHLLTALGHDEFNLEFRVRAGAADIYLPRLRTIIEVKRTGRADHPDRAQGGDRSPFRQLDGYLRSEIAAVRNSRLGDGSDRRWTGMLTDGKVWHRWSYEHRDNPAAQEEDLDFRPAGAGELAGWLRDALSGQPVGRPWIPPNPVRLFEDQARELRDIHDGLTGDVARDAGTKLGLWGDMLRSSGMHPETGPSRNRLFVSHSFLVALARGVIRSMSGERPETDPGHLLADGFVSWIVQTSRGRQWVDGVLERISGYDWRMRRGDVLRPLYEAFVDAGDRRDFGEFYTPDWLAGLMVRETLDDEWCRRAIEAAQIEHYNNEPLKGIGVLDPACGSGTFLYHAVRRLLDHEAMPDSDAERSRIAARLVNGIDIHPVACEFTRATLLRAMPGDPGGLRVYNGDSLQLQGGDDGSLFSAMNGDVQIRSPGGSGMIALPGSFVGRGDLAALVGEFTETALNGTDLPVHIRNSAAARDRGAMDAAHGNLRKIIRREGNSVWAWYITNSVGPYALARHKVDRIVSNPPWVKIAKITVPERHRSLRAAAVRAGLWQGGRLAPQFDIAQLFVKKCRETYLATPGSDPASWIVKASALKAQHWENLREWRDGAGIAGQSADMIDLRVFGGGDARRSCLLFDARKSSLGHARRLKGHCPNGRPDPALPLDEAATLVEWRNAPPPIPVAPSEYLDDPGFRLGATIVPHVLTMAAGTEPASDGRITVRTRPSKHRPWSAVASQRVRVPRRWLLPIINSDDMLAFALRPGDRKLAIAPIDGDGNLLDDASAAGDGEWRRLEDIYAEHRGQGRNTPGTLLAQIDHLSKLSRQLPVARATENAPLNRVLYPNSGDIMRSCRCPAGTAVATIGVYHAVFDTAEEAAYLTALLNAPSLRAAFRESRASNRDFALHPWRNVPIPKFDPKNGTHRKLAALAPEAERAAAELMGELLDGLNGGIGLPGQVGLSSRIRERLLDSGISERIDASAMRLLPEQAGRYN